ALRARAGARRRAGGDGRSDRGRTARAEQGLQPARPADGSGLSADRAPLARALRGGRGAGHHDSAPGAPRVAAGGWHDTGRRVIVPVAPHFRIAWRAFKAHRRVFNVSMLVLFASWATLELCVIALHRFGMLLDV